MIIQSLVILRFYFIQFFTILLSIVTKHLNFFKVNVNLLLFLAPSALNTHLHPLRKFVIWVLSNQLLKLCFLLLLVPGNQLFLPSPKLFILLNILIILLHRILWLILSESSGVLFFVFFIFGSQLLLNHLHFHLNFLLLLE